MNIYLKIKIQSENKKIIPNLIFNESTQLEPVRVQHHYQERIT